MTTTAVPQVWRPSGARMVALDGLLPLPRGVLPSDLPPLVWPAKDPADVLDYALDATAALAGDETDRVATVAVTIVPQASSADLQLGNVVADGAVVVMWLSGGQAGTVYAVQVTLSTLNGRIIGRTVLLPVQQMAAVQPPAGVLTTEAGAIVTDQNGNPILVGA
jgi:ribosomal protein S28E/S33